MKILLSSHLFAPSVGGIEQVSGILAEELTALGHEVRVITETPADREPAGQTFAVFRQPSRFRLFRLLQWCDVYLQSNISLGSLWPAWILRRPVVITYHTWLTRPDGKLGWQDRLKRFCARFASRNLGVSRAMAASVSADCAVIPNPFRDDIFRTDPGVTRDRQLVFLGRLVSDKGADLLLTALGQLKASNLTPTLTIIGTGPEEAALRAQVEALGLASQVSFLGTRTGTVLVRELNRHEIMVIPSRWREPFGLVALEALACGVVPIGADGGGLGDAMGSGGVLFARGDATDLAVKLRNLLENPAARSALLAKAPAHLAAHGRREVARTYVRHFEEVLN